MGKRSNFKRRKADAYDTPAKAVLPLLPHLLPHTRFYEPCAGKGMLMDALTDQGHICLGAGDIHPRRKDIKKIDAMETNYPPKIGRHFYPGLQIITNPPWTREVLHPMIEYLSGFLPTWLLLDADWMHTKQAAPHLATCRKIVSIGRVRWMLNSKNDGVDNSCWYLFDRRKQGIPSPPLFFGRT